MCGIVCAFDLKQKSEILRPQVLEMSKKIRHRGPDWSGIYSDEKNRDVARAFGNCGSCVWETTVAQ